MWRWKTNDACLRCLRCWCRTFNGVDGVIGLTFHHQVCQEPHFLAKRRSCTASESTPPSPWWSYGRKKKCDFIWIRLYCQQLNTTFQLLMINIPNIQIGSDFVKSLKDFTEIHPIFSSLVECLQKIHPKKKPRLGSPGRMLWLENHLWTWQPWQNMMMKNSFSPVQHFFRQHHFVMLSLEVLSVSETRTDDVMKPRELWHMSDPPARLPASDFFENAPTKSEAWNENIPNSSTGLVLNKRCSHSRESTSLNLWSFATSKHHKTHLKKEFFDIAAACDMFFFSKKNPPGSVSSTSRAPWPDKCRFLSESSLLIHDSMIIFQRLCLPF